MDSSQLIGARRIVRFLKERKVRRAIIAKNQKTFKDNQKQKRKIMYRMLSMDVNQLNGYEKVAPEPMPS